MPVEAWIVTVGNELLIGRTINTNAAWLARKLSFLGFKVLRIVVAPDSVDDIAEEVSRALSRARIVVTTGGLGPTYDDVTLEGVSRAIGRRMVLNKEALEMVRRFYEARGMVLTGDRVKMAVMPEGAKPLANPAGAAPGAMVELDGGRLVVSLPGVPREMEAMFEAEVEPVLKDIAGGIEVVECGFTAVGVPESSLAPYIRRAAEASPRAYVKSHPRGSELGDPVVDIKVVASGSNLDEARSEALRALEVVREGIASLGGRISEEDTC